KKGNEIFDKICTELVGKKTSFYVQIRKYNWETKDTSSMSVMKIEEIPGLKSKIKEIFKDFKVNLAPSTPIKNSRKAVIVDLDDEKEEITKKKYKKIKIEPEED
ncbi:hypothetical protein FRX31_017277, partial [Thalictrum thalictroides]